MQLLAERDSDGTTYEYVYGAGVPLELVVTPGPGLTGAGIAKRYAYQTDAGGSVIGITDASGAEIARYAYDPYGNPTATSGTDPLAARNPLRYRGYYWDAETGLYYLPARYYEPRSARFLSVDPAAPSAGDMEATNAYSYCFCNPVGRSDPDGREMLGYMIAMEAAAGMDASTAYAFHSQGGSERARAMYSAHRRSGSRNDRRKRKQAYSRFGRERNPRKGTTAIGDGAVAAFFLGVTVSAQVVWDGNGNVGAQYTFGGVAMAGGGAAAGNVLTTTDASNFAQLAGCSIANGGSATLVPTPVVVGDEGVTDYAGRYAGNSGSLMAGTNLLFPIEGHSAMQYSFIVPQGNTQEIGWAVTNFMDGLAERMAHAAWETGS